MSFVLRQLLIVCCCITVFSSCNDALRHSVYNDRIDGQKLGDSESKIVFRGFAQLPTGEIWIAPAIGREIIHFGKDTYEPQFFYNESVRPVSQLYFRTESDGWMVNEDSGKGLVWRTHDGGRSWSLISTVTPRNPDDSFSRPVQVIFSDDLHGWVIDIFTVWKTDNGGAKWSSVLEADSKLMEGQVAHLALLPNNQVILTSTQGELLYTENGGAKWRAVGICDFAADISFKDSSAGWVLCGEGKVYGTNDAGKTWELFAAIEQNDAVFESLYSINEDNGWITGHKVIAVKNPAHDAPKASWKPFVYHIMNNGRDWRQAPLPDEVTHVSYLNFTADKGILVSKEHIYITADGGKAWQTLSLNH